MLPYWSFQELVFNPVPRSVKGIRVDRISGLSQQKYVFRFKISKADLPAVLASRPFREIAWVKYDDATLEYGDNSHSTRSFLLYDTYDGEHVPSWFQFGAWVNFQAYIVEREELEFYSVSLLVTVHDFLSA